MTVELLTDHHLMFLSSKEAAQARLSLHLLKCHIVGNHMSRLIYELSVSVSGDTRIINDNCCFQKYHICTMSEIIYMHGSSEGLAFVIYKTIIVEF